MPRESSLWRAVISRLLVDATLDLSGIPPSRERRRLLSVRDEARTWLVDGGTEYLEVCRLAGVDPARLKTQVRRLQASGWHTVLSRDDISAENSATLGSNAHAVRGTGGPLLHGGGRSVVDRMFYSVERQEV